jgi:hypothetical protein
MRNGGCGLGCGWIAQRARKIVRIVAPVCFREPGRLSRRNVVAYPPDAFRLHPTLPAIPRQAAPDRPGWLHEIKHDGFRLMARRDAAGVRLLTRNGIDWWARFPHSDRREDRSWGQDLVKMVGSNCIFLLHDIVELDLRLGAFERAGVAHDFLVGLTVAIGLDRGLGLPFRIGDELGRIFAAQQLFRHASLLLNHERRAFRLPDAHGVFGL